MRKKMITVVLAGIMAVSVAACGGTGNSGNENTTATTEKATVQETTEEAAETEKSTYQDVLDEYTKKIQDATPALVEEYNTESVEIAEDINALAELSNSKVEELAVICNDGVQEMAEIMTQNGDAYENYEEWAGKLQDIYMDYMMVI